IAGVAVGGDHDVADLDVAARGRDPPSLAHGRDGLHRRLGAQRDAAAARGIQQSLVVQRRMYLGRALHHHAAVVIVRRHLFALAFPGHHEGARSSIGVQRRDATLLVGVVLGRPRADEAAGLLPVAIDFFTLDQALDQAERVVARGQDVLEHVRLELRDLAGKTLADVDAAADAAAASRAGAGAELGRFKYASFHSGVRKLDGAGKPGITTADNGDACGFRHVNEIAGDGLVGLPPIGLRLEVLVENVAGHPDPTLSFLFFLAHEWRRYGA